MDILLTNVLKQPWKAYCISLPRCTERRERFLHWTETIGLTCSFWDAVDKRELQTPTVLSGNQLSLGATACRLSHEALWKYCLKDPSTKYFFIFEDDAGFKSKTLVHLIKFLQDIQRVNKPWDILQFGFGTMTGTELHLLSKRVPPGIFQVNFCDQTHALLYTRKAIQGMLLLSQDERYKTSPSDGLLLHYVQKKKGIVFAPAQSIIEQTDSVSIIGTL